MEMVSEAFYVGNSTTDSTVPALFRERMLVNAATYTPYTAAEELVQGIENMQVLYGYDADNNGLADRYMKANDSTFATATNWNNVVSVRLTVRMRSIYPVYNKAMSYGTFEGISGTSGSDAYMRQTLSTTVMMRNN
jgi:type IV pilus assembly protein PilW